jgi:hypothetical protein
MDIREWLRSLGLDQYEAAFRQNEVDSEVLPNLTAEDLRELGVVAIGHRRKLIAAIAALADRPVPATSVGAKSSVAPSAVVTELDPIRGTKGR